MGGVAGAAILISILPVTMRGAPGLGQTTINPDISQGDRQLINVKIKKFSIRNVSLVMLVYSIECTLYNIHTHNHTEI
jgi:hypothetical protein